MSERFTSIRNCESYDYWGYSVGNYGTIIDDRTQEPLEQYDIEGYLVVHIIYNDRPRTVYVHRLVADAFVRPPWKKPKSETAGVRHIDGDTHNNYWENLKYTRRVEQPIDYHILTGSWSDLVNQLQVPVYCVELDEVFPSASMASRVLRINRGNLVSHLKGRLPSVNGYTFEFYHGS